jgi:predicted acyl esterase
MQQSFLPRSPYFANAYFNRLSRHTVRPVPVFSIQGWTDPLFPAVQTLQMFQRLKAVDPSYPITMAFADVGHSNAQNPAWQWHPINTLANRFLDARVLGRTSELPRKQTYSFRTQCTSKPKALPPVSGPWNSLSSGKAVASGTGTLTTSSADQNQADGAASDPIANSGCLGEDSNTTDPQGAYWAFKSAGLHLIGLPKLKVAYAMTGQDAVIGLKLWDVAPDGSKTLVTRGEYRLSTAAGDKATGTLLTYLYGNDWMFPAGHQVLLQITQSDSPYLRPDNEPSAIDWSGVTLDLPTRVS